MTPTVFFIAVGIALVIFAWVVWAMLSYKSACNDLRWANTRNKREAETLRSEVATLQENVIKAMREADEALRERDEVLSIATERDLNVEAAEKERDEAKAHADMLDNFCKSYKKELTEAKDDLAKALQREASAQAEEERRTSIIILVKKSGRGRYRLHFIGARTGKTYAISTGGWVDKLEAQQTADYLAESRYRVET